MKKPTLLLLLLLLAGSFFLRSYRSSDLLRFYYDQGRDAQVINSMLATKKPVLVGPTTGLAGILRGPAFYYLLAPGYAIGQGDPAIAALWLQIINLVGLIFLYLFAANLFSPAVGLVSVLFVGFSYHFVSLSRWLSNPSAILTSVPIMLYGLLNIQKGKSPHIWYPIVALMLGLNLQFEIASEFWFIPIVLFLLITGKLNRPTKKVFLVSSLMFLLTLAPQIIFDLRHQGIMRIGIQNNFSSGEQSFGYDNEIIRDHLNIYVEAITDLISENNFLAGFIALTLALILPIFDKKHAKSAYPVFYLLFLFPLFVLLFYVGNGGNFYKYYLIGLLPIFAVLLSASLVYFSSHSLGRFLVLAVALFFFTKNYYLHRTFFANNLTGIEHVSLGNQLQAIDWVYQAAAGQSFSLDVYVPPVIPYSYDYLLSWYAQKKYHYLPSASERIYFTINEIDTQNPERLKMWLDNHNYGPISDRVQFGGIQVLKHNL